MLNEEIPNGQMLKDIFIAKLSGIAEYKNEKEIWWENATGERVTIEFVDNTIDDIIVRSYYHGSEIKHWECDVADGNFYRIQLWDQDGRIMFDEKHINLKKMLGEEYNYAWSSQFK